MGCEVKAGTHDSPKSLPPVNMAKGGNCVIGFSSIARNPPKMGLPVSVHTQRTPLLPVVGGISWCKANTIVNRERQFADFLVIFCQLNTNPNMDIIINQSKTNFRSSYLPESPSAEASIPFPSKQDNALAAINY